MALGVVAADFALLAVAVALGEPLLRLAERIAGALPAPPSVLRLGLVLLLGIGAWGYVGVALGLARIFVLWSLAAAAAAALVLGRRALGDYARWLASRRPRRDRVVLLLAAVAAVLLAFRWLAALAPPEAYDELAYHVPEARAILDAHTLHLRVGPDQTYGNLPLLAETLYAGALAVQGTALVHTVHLTVLAAFLVLAAGVVRRLHGGRAAALAVVLLLLFEGLLYNATTGYVDAAALSFELGAALALALWIAADDPGLAAAAALLLGFGLSIKYSVLTTAAFCAVVVLVRRPRLAPRLAALALAACGFWYGKNLVRFGNPFYPLYLGHSGISDETYRAFLASVQQFGPRTPKAFVEVPWRYAADSALVPFLGFYLAPFALLVRHGRAFAAALLAYAVAFATAWFWLASHQPRFLMPAVAAALVLTAIAAAHAPAAARVAMVAVAVAAVALAQARVRTFSLADAHGAVEQNVGWNKVRYVLGGESRAAYLRSFFGCEYDATVRAARGEVAVREGSLAPWWDMRFRPLVSHGATAAAVDRELRPFRWVYARGGAAESITPNPVARRVLAERARLVWRRDDCALYRLE